MVFVHNIEKEGKSRMNRPSISYTIDPIIFPSSQMDKFQEFMNQYGAMPYRQLLQEMAMVKTQVSADDIQKYVNNLDHFAQMDGFVTEDHRRRIQDVRNVLLAPSAVAQPESNADSQFFFAGPALLLWFLALAAIWRRPIYGGFPYGGFPYGGFPYGGYPGF